MDKRLNEFVDFAEVYYNRNHENDRKGDNTMNIENFTKTNPNISDILNDVLSGTENNTEERSPASEDKLPSYVIGDIIKSDRITMEKYKNIWTNEIYKNNITLSTHKMLPYLILTIFQIQIIRILMMSLTN